MSPVLVLFSRTQLRRRLQITTLLFSKLEAGKVSNKYGQTLSPMRIEQDPAGILCCPPPPSVYWTLKLALKTQVSAVPLVQGR